MLDAFIYIFLGFLGIGSVWLFRFSRSSISDFDFRFDGLGIARDSTYDKSSVETLRVKQTVETYHREKPPSRINLNLEVPEPPDEQEDLEMEEIEEASEAEEATSEETDETSGLRKRRLKSGDRATRHKSGSLFDEWEVDELSLEEYIELSRSNFVWALDHRILPPNIWNAFEKPVKFEGSAYIPERVYVDNSHRVRIEFIRDGAPEIQAITDMSEAKDSANAIPLSFSFVELPKSDTLEDVLEVELHSAGIEVNSEATQRRSLLSNRLEYQWNCHFPNSGDHYLDLAFKRRIGDVVVPVGRIERQVKVVRLDGMTSRQVQTISYFCGGVAGVVGFIKVLQELGVF